MFATTDPNMIIGGLALAGLVVVAFWRLIVWVRDAPVKPDPWETDVAQKLDDPEVPETCPRCSAPQPTTAWFCEHCGRAVGPYNNMMPFLQVFSEGEVFRNGTDRNLRKRPLVIIGYFLLGIGLIPIFLAPIYWLSLINTLARKTGDQSPPPEA